MYLRTIVQVPERSHEKPNFRAALGPEVAFELDLDVLENKVAGLLHLEGEGVAVKPQEPVNDVEEALEEVLDRAQGRKQHLPSTTQRSQTSFLVPQQTIQQLTHFFYKAHNLLHIDILSYQLSYLSQVKTAIILFLQKIGNCEICLNPTKLKIVKLRVGDKLPKIFQDKSFIISYFGNYVNFPSFHYSGMMTC